MKFLSDLKTLALCCVAAVTLALPVQADITVFAAASLRGALDEIATLSDTPVTLSYGGSGTIARQVAQGAPADVVILAHPRWMDWLEGQNVLMNNSRQVIAHNSLVLIGATGAAPLNDVADLPQRLGQSRLAMGQRDAVPAGIYAKSWLQTAGLWDRLETQLAEVENVRLALALVARQETPMGVVYRSDALAESKVDVVFDIPEASHDPIQYPAASTSENGLNFINLLTSSKASLILENHGLSAPKVDQ